MAFHAHRLLRIFLEDDPVEDICKDIKRLLHPLRLGRHDESIVDVEVRFKVLYEHAKSLRARLSCRRHHQPVADVGVNNHVKYRGGQGVSLIKYAVSLEGGAGSIVKLNV